MKRLTWLFTLLLSYSLAGIGVVQAAGAGGPFPIVVRDASLPSFIPFTVQGMGKLEYENEVTGEENEYKGLVRCTLNVSMNAPDKLSIKQESIPYLVKVKAKSKNGNLVIKECSVNGLPVPVGAVAVAGEVKVSIKGLNFSGVTFTEFEASGESASEEQEVKLELDNGFITANRAAIDRRAAFVLFGPGGVLADLGYLLGF